MKFKPLWLAEAEAPPVLAEILAEAFGDTPVALTVISPPRNPVARIEALYAEEPDLAALTATLALTAMLHGAKPPKIKIREVPDLDWVRKVSADFPPLRIARWTVHGAQHRRAVPDRRRALQIDATSAFGTGEHPTTKGCLIMLDHLFKNRRPGRRMLDMGCGSGILAMAYAKTWGGIAVGVDCDAGSIGIALDNARINGLRAHMRLATGNGYRRDIVRSHAPYDLIMANIFARPLATMARDLNRHLRPGGYVILSGFLSHQVNLVLAAHRIQKIHPVKRLRLGDWVVLVLRKASP